MLGGVNGNEVNGYTFESKVVKNLYICGEALDVCGECGGFNLHFAFASGIITEKTYDKNKQYTFTSWLHKWNRLK